MTKERADVLIVGGGIAGMATAYFLGKAGVKCVVVERDSVGSHASGFAYGGLSSLGGVGTPGPTYSIALLGMRLHAELSEVLPSQTGVDVEFRSRPSLGLAFTEEEVHQLQAGLRWQQAQPGYSVRWLEAAEVRSIDSRISPLVAGGVLIEGGAEVEPYRFVLALAQAAESMGTTIRHGTVTGLKREGDRVRGVALERDEIACDRVVLAMGPWSGQCSDWLEAPIPVTPLKGQIIRLRAPGEPLGYSIGWAGNYATTKPDGLLWAGTTEEEGGFDEGTTTEARDSIMASLLKMLPSLEEAELVQQTACLRPVSADGLLLLGPVPGWEGVYMATGAGRKGILLGPAMGHVMADLLTKGSADVPIDELDPGRFARADPDAPRGKPTSTFLPGA